MPGPMELDLRPGATAPELQSAIAHDHILEQAELMGTIREDQGEERIAGRSHNYWSQTTVFPYGALPLIS